MYLQFDRTEYEERIARARTALRDEELDALLVFAPESHYYLTGFDTTGFVFFQCLVLTASDQRLVLLTRRPDLLQARKTSIIEDIRVWYDAHLAAPTLELRQILEELGLKGARIGVEMSNFGLKAADYHALRNRLDSWCELVDGSHVVRTLRLIKSASELIYVRRAARSADQAFRSMIEASGAGAYEGDIAAAGAQALLASGCDPAPSGPVLGSGDRALLVRATTNYRSLGDNDQLTIEFAASYRHYCCCLMRTISIGAPKPLQRHMFSVARDALQSMTEAARPHRPIGEIDQAHRDVFDRGGYGESRMAACGYSLGATFRPTWMDVPPMIYADNPLTMAPGMVLFLHAILADKTNGLAMSIGHTIIITDTGPEVVSRLPLEYVVR